MARTRFCFPSYILFYKKWSWISNQNCKSFLRLQGFGQKLDYTKNEKTAFYPSPENRKHLLRKFTGFKKSIYFQVHPMEQALELYNSVMESPHRNYIVSSLFLLLSIIFVFGLCFGRITNRMRNEIKNR